MWLTAIFRLFVGSGTYLINDVNTWIVKVITLCFGLFPKGSHMKLYEHVSCIRILIEFVMYDSIRTTHCRTVNYHTAPLSIQLIVLQSFIAFPLYRTKYWRNLILWIEPIQKSARQLLKNSSVWPYCSGSVRQFANNKGKAVYILIAMCCKYDIITVRIRRAEKRWNFWKAVTNICI